MASFKICVRKQRKDGLWPIYLRLVHNRSVAYLKTDLVVNAAGLNKRGEVRDGYVLKRCMEKIEGYAERLNRRDVAGWDALQIKRFLTSGSNKSSFTMFATSYIDRMEAAGSIANAKIYRTALNSLQKYFNTDDIGFDELTREAIIGWIDKLGRTKRARTLYPTCIRVIFNEAMLVSQDPGASIAPITYNPWGRITIPRSETPRKRAVSAEECRKFFEFQIPAGVKGARKAQFGQDVAMLSFCLAAINTVDLWKLRKSDLKDGVLRYCRSKTKHRRKDGAYIEMRVTPQAARLIEKYKAPDDDELLLTFGRSYSSPDSFVAYVDGGIALVCEQMKKNKGDYLSFYTFRHTWATIARNDCGASLSDVGFAMNHIQAFAVTRGYIKPDFTPAWELNERVVDYVLGKQESGKVGQETNPADTPTLSPSALLRVAVFLKGKCVVNFEDIGYSSVDDVMHEVRERMPDGVSPDKVTVKVVNCDTGEVAKFSS